MIKYELMSVVVYSSHQAYEFTISASGSRALLHLINLQIILNLPPKTLLNSKHSKNAC